MDGTHLHRKWAMWGPTSRNITDNPDSFEFVVLDLFLLFDPLVRSIQHPTCWVTVTVISVCSLSKYHNCNIIFNTTYCVIQVSKTGQTIGGGGHDCNGLYYVDQVMQSNSSHQSSANTGCWDNICVWGTCLSKYWRMSILLWILEVIQRGLTIKCVSHQTNARALI